MLLWAALATAQAAASGPARATEPLRVCLAAHNLPMSTSHPPWGIDGELAQSIARHLNRPLEFVWQQDQEQSPEQALRDGHCDAAMGAILEAQGLAQGSRVPGLALTKPYYRAGYLLIHAAGVAPARSLAEIGLERIGVEMVSIPIYTLKQRGMRVHALDDSDAVVRAVSEGRVRYGYVWGPVAAWLTRDRKDVVLGRDFQPVERWDFAIAVRAKQHTLRQALDEAIDRLLASGEAAQIFARYKVPYLQPARP